MPHFLEVSDLKKRLDVAHLDVVENPKTGKLFAVGLDSNNKEIILRIEQAIDFTLPVKYLVEDISTLTEGCIINVKPSNPPVHRF